MTLLKTWGAVEAVVNEEDVFDIVRPMVVLRNESFVVSIQDAVKTFQFYQV